MSWGAAYDSSDPMTKKLATAFMLFDKDKSGTIDASELKEILTRAGNRDTIALSEKDAEELIADFDDNGDGVFSLEELVKCWGAIGSNDEAKIDAAIAERRAKVAARNAAKFGGGK